jgi:hypothetical protein
LLAETEPLGSVDDLLISELSDDEADAFVVFIRRLIAPCEAVVVDTNVFGAALIRRGAAAERSGLTC